MKCDSQIISFVLGLLSSLIIGLSIIYWQFSQSIAGYRLKKISDATREIIAEVKSHSSYTGTLRNKYRYSLGVIIDRMVQSFGTKSIPNKKSQYPCLLSFGENDRWDTFNLYVRPVINDLNSYAFIGWIPFVPKLRRLQSLINLCRQLETVTAELDSLRLLEKSKKLSIFEIESNEILKINDSNDQNVQMQINNLISEYQLLETYWKQWLSLVEK